jgi:hypothetical protein
MSSDSEKTVIRARAAPATLKISDWPLRDEPLQSGLLVALVLAISAIGAVAVQHIGMALILFGLFGAMLGRVWFPAVFEMGSKGVIQTRLGRKRRVPWTEFARYEIHTRGMLLCADLEPNPFSAWRGLFIPWDDKRDEVLAVVEFYLHGPLQTALLSTRSLSQVNSPSTTPPLTS